MLADAGYIYHEQVLWIIFGILSDPLTLCMLMLFRSFSAPSMLMVMSSMLGYLVCDHILHLSRHLGDPGNSQRPQGYIDDQNWFTCISPDYIIM